MSDDRLAKVLGILEDTFMYELLAENGQIDDPERISSALQKAFRAARDEAEKD